MQTVAVLGNDYVGMKPTMHIKEGDRVKLGQKLFSDKRNEGVHFTAPASGTVVNVHRGAKRVLLSVVIEIQGDEAEQFGQYTVEEISSLEREQIVSQLGESGMWCSFRTRPFSRIPAIDSTPHSIFVTAIDTNPLSADPATVIADSGDDFRNGLKIVAKLTEGKIFVCTDEALSVSTDVSSVVHETFSGPHPAGLAGTHIHYLDPVSANKTVWTINYQDVIAIARLFESGKLSTQRIVALGGPNVKQPRLLKSRLGASIAELVDGELNEGLSAMSQRVISGSVLSGFKASGEVAYLGRYHNQVSVLPEGGERKLFGYLAPGMRQHSVLPIFLSRWFNKGTLDISSDSNGSARAMVPVGSYETVMPLDILATQLLRSLLTTDLELAIDLGCLELDEEDLALCTYACPGKYEYGSVLRRVLNTIEKEG